MTAASPIFSSVARTWLQIKVELESGRDIVCDPKPGRIFIIGPSHTFEQLANSINVAFARWDLGHLHVFELGDGRRIGHPDDDDVFDLGWVDHGTTKVAREVKPGDRFTYTFDLGDEWRHQCEVLAEKLDPLEEYGGKPDVPASIWGWGWIPDQYGRRSGNPDEE